MAMSEVETVTIGTLIGGVITILIAFLRNMGKRADPQLIALMSDMLVANTESTAMYKKLDETIDKMGTILEKINTDTTIKLDNLASAVDRNTGTTNALKDTLEGDTVAGRLLALSENNTQIARVIQLLESIAGKYDALEGKIDLLVTTVETSMATMSDVTVTVSAVQGELVELRGDLESAKEQVKTITQKTPKAGSKTTAQRPATKVKDAQESKDKPDETVNL